MPQSNTQKENIHPKLANVAIGKVFKKVLLDVS
jgi:hypothetical protein